MEVNQASLHKRISELQSNAGLRKRGALRGAAAIKMDQSDLGKIDSNDGPDENY